MEVYTYGIAGPILLFATVSCQILVPIHDKPVPWSVAGIRSLTNLVEDWLGIVVSVAEGFSGHEEVG